MFFETSQSQVIPKSLCPVPVLSPVFLTSQFTISGASWACNTKKSAPSPLDALSTGAARNRSALSFDNSLDSAHKTLAVELRLLPLQTTSQLFRDSAVGLLCTKWLGRVAPLLGGRGSCLLKQDDVSVHYSGHQGPWWASEDFGSMACPWPRGDTHCHNAHWWSPHCISMSIWKLSYCSKASQSVWMQHFWTENYFHLSLEPAPAPGNLGVEQHLCPFLTECWVTFWSFPLDLD